MFNISLERIYFVLHSRKLASRSEFLCLSVLNCFMIFLEYFTFIFSVPFIITSFFRILVLLFLFDNRLIFLIRCTKTSWNYLHSLGGSLVLLLVLSISLHVFSYFFTYPQNPFCTSLSPFLSFLFLFLFLFNFLC